MREEYQGHHRGVQLKVPGSIWSRASVNPRGPFQGFMRALDWIRFFPGVQKGSKTLYKPNIYTSLHSRFHFILHYPYIIPIYTLPYSFSFTFPCPCIIPIHTLPYTVVSTLIPLSLETPNIDAIILSFCFIFHYPYPT